MVLIAFILWILIWGLAGYFTVRAIRMGIERRRSEMIMAEYLAQRQALKRYANTFEKNQLKANPFDNL